MIDSNLGQVPFTSNSAVSIFLAFSEVSDKFREKGFGMHVRPSKSSLDK